VTEWGGQVSNDGQYNGRSTSGYIFTLGGGAVAWASEKQKVVALSSMESEYMAACEATKHASWVMSWFGELSQGVDGSWQGGRFQHLGLKDLDGTSMGLQRPIVIQCDSTSAIALMQKPGVHKRSKHISLKWHFIRERVSSGDVKFEFVGTNDQAADMLTKPVNSVVLSKCCNLVGLLKSW